MRKIIIAGECTLALAAVTYICSELALMERGYSAVGGEIIGIAILTFAIFTGAKTIKDIRKGWKRGKER